MADVQSRASHLTEEQQREVRMLLLEDDTEEAPWMVMGDLQFWTASTFAHILRIHAREQGLTWYVASMLPVRYRWKTSRIRQLAPDVFVAFAADRPRSSFDVDAEGGFPPFVLEVVSPSSTERDLEDKREAYEKLGVIEYAVFTPRSDAPSTLEGFRRSAPGTFETWPSDVAGRLWSETLGLFLVAGGPLLRAQTREGRILPTPDEMAAEIDRLRRELERYPGQDR